MNTNQPKHLKKQIAPDYQYPLHLNFHTQIFYYEVKWSDKQHLYIAATQKSEPTKVYTGIVVDQQASESSITTLFTYLLNLTRLTMRQNLDYLSPVVEIKDVDKSENQTFMLKIVYFENMEIEFSIPLSFEQRSNNAVCSESDDEAEGKEMDEEEVEAMMNNLKLKEHSSDDSSECKQLSKRKTRKVKKGICARIFDNIRKKERSKRMRKLRHAQARIQKEFQLCISKMNKISLH